MHSTSGATRITIDCVNICEYLHDVPSIVWTIVSIVLCGFFILFAEKKFGKIGLCVYMCIVAFISNVQILYATTYEILNIHAFLGTSTFASSYLACDILSYKYGSGVAKKAVLLSVIMQIFIVLNIVITFAHKPIDCKLYPNFSIDEYTLLNNINAIKTVFLPLPQLLFSSYCAYFASQFTEIYGGKLIKRMTYVKHNILLFVSSIIVDTFVFTFVNFVLLASMPLNQNDFADISYSAICIRLICNLINSIFFKYYTKARIKSTI